MESLDQEEDPNHVTIEDEYMSSSDDE